MVASWYTAAPKGVLQGFTLMRVIQLADATYSEGLWRGMAWDFMHGRGMKVDMCLIKSLKLALIGLVVVGAQLEYTGWVVQALWTFIAGGIYNIDYRNNKYESAYNARG
jgi:hypothetical protein